MVLAAALLTLGFAAPDPTAADVRFLLKLPIGPTVADLRKAAPKGTRISRPIRLAVKKGTLPSGAKVVVTLSGAVNAQAMFDNFEDGPGARILAQRAGSVVALGSKGASKVKTGRFAPQARAGSDARDKAVIAAISKILGKAERVDYIKDEYNPHGWYAYWQKGPRRFSWSPAGNEGRGLDVHVYSGT